MLKYTLGEKMGISQAPKLEGELCGCGCGCGCGRGVIERNEEGHHFIVYGMGRVFLGNWGKWPVVKNVVKKRGKK